MDEMEKIRSDLYELEILFKSRTQVRADGHDPAFVRHVELSIDDGLLEGAVVTKGDDRSRTLQIIEPFQFTDRGHRFMDAVRIEADWEKVKERLRAADHDLDTVALAVVVDTAIAMNQPNP